MGYLAHKKILFRHQHKIYKVSDRYKKIITKGKVHARTAKKAQRGSR
jgi:hypothetical protein